MTIVETTVKLSIPAEVFNLEELEGQIAESLWDAGKDLLKQACKQMDEALIASSPALRRVKRRGLHLLTRFGWMRLRRWQVRGEDGRYHYPLNTLLGLQSRQHASPWIIDRAVSLATRSRPSGPRGRESAGNLHPASAGPSVVGRKRVGTWWLAEERLRGGSLKCIEGMFDSGGLKGG